MVRPLRAETSSASPQAVESPVNRCTQVVHRNRSTPLHNRGKIVDMIAPVRVSIAGAALASRQQCGVFWGLALFDAGVDGAVELVFL
jgi:hypothetical protein